MTTPPASPLADPPEEPVRHRPGEHVIELLRRAHTRGADQPLDLGGRPALLITEPATVRHVLARHPDSYVKRSHRARVLLGDGLIAVTGEQWRTQRRVMQPHFTARNIRVFEPAMRRCAGRVARRWARSAETGQPRDLVADMRHFALDVIWSSMTGLPLEEADHHDLLAAGRIVDALPAFAPDAPPGQADLAADLARVDDAAARAIAAARSHTGPSLLHPLLDAADQLPDPPERLVRDELVTLLVAGYETTAATLAWAFLLLDKHPDEHRRVLEAGPDGSPERRAAIRAVLDETLRLYPTAWLLPRYATEPDTLAGHPVDAGTTLLLCPYLTHRDPAVWPEPDGFRPGRFTSPNPRPTPGTYYPFGVGPRACIGVHFSLHEMTILLEHLLPSFTPALHHPLPAPAFGITVHPDGPLHAHLHATPTHG
ncbi:cytochrome P450 [Streptomyces sp. UNOB3_S3]|uniref:cytochrome P450 n=1 Tax=Streptomyces sp. UNOB3_S3 TaxID=2871682 RepID=UPI001E3DFD24|nr:cytochrome P450 [Streptomyces sp. UNOB3_S3]